MPELNPAQWTLGLVCAYFTGISKTGLPGLGILTVPLMVLAVGDAKQSAGWLLPMLCTADVFAVLYWRRHPAAGRLFLLAPWVLAGMAAGAFALSMHERTVRTVVAVIVLIMLGIYILRRLRPDIIRAGGHGAPYGVTAGFATTVANAAGPVMNLYLLTRRLTKEEFVATGAWFFFAINLTKVPIYAWHGLLSARSLTFDAVMLPAVVAGAVTGRWIVYHVPEGVFEAAVVVLTMVSTLMLFR